MELRRWTEGGEALSEPGPGGEMPRTRGERVADAVMVGGVLGVPMLFGAPLLLGVPMGIGIPMLFGASVPVIGAAFLLAAGLVPAAYHGWRAFSRKEDGPQARSRKQRDLAFSLYMLAGCLGAGGYLATALLGLENTPGLRQAVLACSAGLILLALAYTDLAQNSAREHAAPPPD